MTYYIAGSTAVDNARSLSQSALPNAPQQPYDEPGPRRPFDVRARIGAALRAAAAQETRLANRIDPTPTCPAATA